MFPGFKKQSLEKETKKEWQQSDKYFYQEPTGPVRTHRKLLTQHGVGGL